MRNNLYKVKKHTVTEKGTDKVLSIYYSIGWEQKLFFNLFGPYVWWDINEFHYRKDGFGSFYSTTSCNFNNYDEAVEICNEFNKPLIEKSIEKCEFDEIVYEGVESDK